MLAAVIVLQLALVLFMQVEVFTAMVVARFLQGGASSVVFSGAYSRFHHEAGAHADHHSWNGSHVSFCYCATTQAWCVLIALAAKTFPVNTLVDRLDGDYQEHLSDHSSSVPLVSDLASPLADWYRHHLLEELCMQDSAGTLHSYSVSLYVDSTF